MMRTVVAGGVLLLMACTENAKLGKDLRAFCSLVEEGQRVHPDDRAAWSRYVSERSDAAMTSKDLVEVMRALAVSEPSDRPEILADAGRRGGLGDFECPAILSLYQ